MVRPRSSTQVDAGTLETQKIVFVANAGSGRSIVTRHCSHPEEVSREICRLWSPLRHQGAFYELGAGQQIALGRKAHATHVRGGADLIAEFEASNFNTLKEFTEARAETVDDLVARPKLARSDTPHIRIMARALLQENSIRLPEGSLAFQKLLEICADTFIEAKRNELAKLRDRAVHDSPNPH